MNQTVCLLVQRNILSQYAQVLRGQNECPDAMMLLVRILSRQAMLDAMLEGMGVSLNNEHNQIMVTDDECPF